VATDSHSLPMGKYDARAPANGQRVSDRPSSISLYLHERFCRVRDVAAAGLLLVFFAPLILASAALVMLVSPGPAFIRSERVGLRGRTFGMFKLRSMQVDAAARLDIYLAAHPELSQEWQQSFKLKDDPRIIPWIGSFIRKSSIDELPQLLNILRGEMSLVGPRPFPAYHLSAFDSSFRTLRASVRPGLTGLWQVRCRNSGGLDAQQYWDGQYVRDRSFTMDLRILWKTIWVVLAARNVA
jgi:lipopolysaccharide/colanic/teichoic acid biosynthesis glycosyltransferase